MREFRLTGLFMGDEEQIDHPAAGVPARQISLQHLPGFSVFGPGKQAVAVDRTPQGLWFASQGVDDMVVVDDMNAVTIAAPAGTGMADDPERVNDFETAGF